MAVELPQEVVVFLNFIGVPYPDIDEDQVRELAGHVRTFASEVSGTHESATGTITEMGAVYQGQSYRALVESWAQLSSTHMERLDELCRGVAIALEVTADVITVVKVAVLAELAFLAAAYTAAMAATVATSGASAAVGQSLAMAARRLVRAMEEMLVAYILAEVLGKAIEPLEEAVSDMISGAVYGATADLLGVDPGGKDVVLVEPDELRRYAKVLDDHADEILTHAADFGQKVSALDFSTPAGPPGIATVPDGGRSGTTGPGPASARNGMPTAEVPANNPVQRNWIPDSARGADLPAEGTAASPSASPPVTTAPEGTGAPAVPGGASAPENGSAPSPAQSAPLPAQSVPSDTRSAIDVAQPAAAPRPEDAGSRAESGPVQESAPASSGHTAASAGIDPVGRSEPGVEEDGKGPAVRPDTPAAALPGAPAPAGQGREQPNPWSRPAAQAGGPANRGAGPAPPAKSPGAAASNRPGAQRKGNPWGRPASEPATVPSPWSRPVAPAARPVPDRPAVEVTRDTAPPAPVTLSGSRAKSPDAASTPAPGPSVASPASATLESDAEIALESRRTEGEHAAAVSPPSLRDEGPPRG